MLARCLFLAVTDVAVAQLEKNYSCTKIILTIQSHQQHIIYKRWFLIAELFSCVCCIYSGIWIHLDELRVIKGRINFCLYYINCFVTSDGACKGTRHQG